ncbi:MAG: DUF992 domain-containing protein [Deltaproteobacteria bacterium]|nr:DUF992 domain-containing protein [Deltaproteobacteria bacterium]
MKASIRKALLAASALAFVATATSARAEETGIKTGFLTCHVASGFGFIFGSSKEVKCTYTSLTGKSDEHYAGDISKFGVDIGYSGAGIIAWAVFAPTPDVAKGALAGQYAGVGASGSAGPGVGAHVLLGGFNKSFTLQPVSLEGLTGLNVAGGIEALSLQSVN